MIINRRASSDLSFNLTTLDAIEMIDMVLRQGSERRNTVRSPVQHRKQMMAAWTRETTMEVGKGVGSSTCF